MPPQTKYKEPSQEKTAPNPGGTEVSQDQRAAATEGPETGKKKPRATVRRKTGEEDNNHSDATTPNPERPGTGTNAERSRETKERRMQARELPTQKPEETYQN